MLIASPRHTREDLRVWAERERMDRALGASGALLHVERQAMTAISAFVVDGPCYVSVSWGKDSTALAHLAIRVERSLPLIWFPADRIDNPDCKLVRDAFLSRFPGTRYFEIGVPGDGDPDSWDVKTSSRRISGLRADESAVRDLSAAVHGLATQSSCRPLLRWTLAHVFAYLARHDLPIHPAYACSMGGAIERDGVRVGPLGGDRGCIFGRAEWERRYYPEVVQP